VVDRSYIESDTPIVRDPLVKAGVRLAGLLNQAVGAEPPTISGERVEKRPPGPLHQPLNQ
jgi:hypothetical protein